MDFQKSDWNYQYSVDIKMKKKVLWAIFAYMVSTILMIKGLNILDINVYDYSYVLMLVIWLYIYLGIKSICMASLTPLLFILRKKMDKITSEQREALLHHIIIAGLTVYLFTTDIIQNIYQNI